MTKPSKSSAVETSARAKPLRDILNSLRARESEMARLLSRFVRAESPSDDKTALDRFSRMLAGEWRSRGARVQLVRQSHAANLVRVDWSPSHKSPNAPILLLGHFDTVYDLGTLARMPFRIRGGRAYGPGTFDMKSGLVIALFAVDALQRLGLKPRRPIVGLWTPDEEIGSHASRRLIEQEARRSAAVLVLEPAARKEGKLKTARKGVGEVTLEVTGRAAHAGLDPQSGINAIEELALQIARIRSFNQPERGITVNADVIAGGTRANVIAEKVRAIVDVRASNARDIRALEAKFRALRPILPGAKLIVRGGFNRPPLERKMSAALFSKAKRIGEILGLRIDECAVGGGSDGCFTAALGVPTLDGLGGVGDGAHAANEHVLLRALPERAALLAALLLEL